MTSSPFSRAVVNAMRKLYPEALADKTWDNTGLLLEAPFDPLRRNNNSILLTIDLTKAVTDEAIARNDSIVVTYHPTIFRGLKSLTLANSQQQSLLRLAAKGISVYSPHTAVDAAPNGLGDWMADIVTGGLEKESSLKEAVTVTKAASEQSSSTLTIQHYPPFDGRDRQNSNPDLVPHKRSPIKPVSVEGVQRAGMGRLVYFEQPQPLDLIIKKVARGLGNPTGMLPVAIPQGSNISDIEIRSVGICAGSGGSLFAGLDVDLLFTGELSHHEALAAIEKGQCVIAPFHSNSERGFLYSVLKGQLLKEVREEWNKLRKAELAVCQSEELSKVLEDSSVSVDVSNRDRDPYGIITFTN